MADVAVAADEIRLAEVSTTRQPDGLVTCPGVGHEHSQTDRLKRSAMNNTPSQPAPARLAVSRPGTRPRRRRTTRTRRLVIGVDGSAGSAAALRWATAEACRRRAALQIVAAWEPPDPAAPGPSRPGDRAQIAATRAQKALGRVLREPQQPARVCCAVPEGNPGGSAPGPGRGHRPASSRYHRNRDPAGARPGRPVLPAARTRPVVFVPAGDSRTACAGCPGYS